MLRDALEGVIRVADRKTDEFDTARAVVAATYLPAQPSPLFKGDFLVLINGLEFEAPWALIPQAGFDYKLTLPAQPVAEGYEELTDDQIFNFWLFRDCMAAIQAGDIRAQFISAGRALLASGHPSLEGRVQLATLCIERGAALIEANADRAQLAERVAVLEAALEKAANITGAFCACDDAEMQKDIAFILQQRAARIRGLTAATPQPHADEAAKGGWQPMSTAPLDGTQVIVRYPSQGNVKRLASYQKLHKFWVSNGEPFWPVQQGCEWAAIPVDSAPPSPAEDKT
jgi:hypothetical protein